MESEYFSQRFWQDFKNEEEARDAVKMAGLPVFLLSLNAWFFSLMMFERASQPLGAIWAALVIGVVLMVIAIRIRSGHSALMPFALVALFAFLTLVLLQTISDIMMDAPWQIKTVKVIRGWVVPVLCSILAYRGLRAWFWLRAHKFAMSY